MSEYFKQLLLCGHFAIVLRKYVIIKFFLSSKAYKTCALQVHFANTSLHRCNWNKWLCDNRLIKSTGGISSRLSDDKHTGDDFFRPRNKLQDQITTCRCIVFSMPTHRLMRNYRNYDVQYQFDVTVRDAALFVIYQTGFLINILPDRLLLGSMWTGRIFKSRTRARTRTRVHFG